MNRELPDFLKWESFNSLRERMEATLIGPFGPKWQAARIKIPLFDQLQNGGVDVGADQFSELRDGTLEYSGYRVLIYIRDISVINGEETLPRYHLAYCRTLENMKRANRFGRYVVSNAETGMFHVNIINGDGCSTRREMVPLKVCQNCLDRIGWNGFKINMRHDDRRESVNGFKLSDFFKQYPRDLLSKDSAQPAATAPLNTYPFDWQRISEEIRRKRKYKCERCNRELDQSASRFLHVHHRNGLKHDNREENLEVLCVRCHAEEPMHGQVRRLPEYQDFDREYGDRY
ncbi:HNH endonuclease [Caballeronia jiangsuensis]|uniref:HNH endonuclease n=1 Tax=Caballeronia jiangsuensis TaxID=1458357 RepID=A0ABW9CLQ1_9BURK